MNVRFDPNALSPEEKVSLARTMVGLPPASPLVLPPCFDKKKTSSAPSSTPSTPKKKRSPDPSSSSSTAPPRPQEPHPKPPSEAPKSTTKPPPPMRPKKDQPKSRPIHLWQPSVWDMAKPFYDWCDPQCPPDHLPLPQNWTLEHIITPPNLFFPIARQIGGP